MGASRVLLVYVLRRIGGFQFLLISSTNGGSGSPPHRRLSIRPGGAQRTEVRSPPHRRLSIPSGESFVALLCSPPHRRLSIVECALDETNTGSPPHRRLAIEDCGLVAKQAC